MENSKSESSQPTSLFTVADLEGMIVKIVQQVLKQETLRIKDEEVQVETGQAENPPEAFLETFGTWEDTRTTEEIIDDIYGSRTLSE
ncbi:hypothetical protein NDA03_15745 [Trichocoleus sp. Lan]|uniref:hypothetical protein n=1 Tax=Trichocoleus sp. Lan TaxID=2933927 RepID=UPI003296B77B